MEKCEHNGCQNEATWLAEVTDKLAGLNGDVIMVCDVCKKKVEAEVGRFGKADFEKV